MILISFTCLIIGLAFTFVGASLILPFAGLEILLVILCTYIVFKKTAVKEVIHLTPQKLKIEKGTYKAMKVWEYFRLWSFIIVEKPKHPWYPAHIVITSKGQRIPIGNFLTEDEKRQLINRLEKIIYSYQ